ncbi:MAG: efflux RND transporter periplasmic adaptor subunit [Planctomycetota bacterium]
MSVSPTAPRRGIGRPLYWAAVPLVLALPLLAHVFLPRAEEGFPDDPMIAPVIRRPFLHEVSAKGELESAGTTDVMCEVKSRSSWIRILDVVAEGTYVEPGDFLVQLDSSGLERERTQQEITCERYKASLIRAERNYDIALATKDEYLDGLFALAKQRAEVTIFMAEDKVRKAAQYLTYSRRLHERGFVTTQQLEADEYSLRAAETDLSLANRKLDVLENFTKVKQLEDLKAAVVVARSYLESAKFTYEREQKELKEIEEQITKCTIRAPVAGKVVLAHLHHNDHSHMVAPGEQTVQNRVLVRLPDPSRMQVKAKIPEECIALVRPEMSTTIYVEAFPREVLRGKVLKVNEFPQEPTWFEPNRKLYEAIVSIETPLDGLRPGMSADLTVCVNEQAAELQVPSQAVLTRGGMSFCVVWKDGRPEAREIQVGPTNDDTYVIRSGVAEGENVALRPLMYAKALGLPDAPSSAVATEPPMREQPPPEKRPAAADEPA